MDDFMLARKIFPNDEMISKITDVLQLSQHGLLYAPNQLAPQILGRLSRTKVTHELQNEETSFVVSDQLGHKPSCRSTKDGWRLEI